MNSTQKNNDENYTEGDVVFTKDLGPITPPTEDDFEHFGGGGMLIPLGGENSIGMLFPIGYDKDMNKLCQLSMPPNEANLEFHSFGRYEIRKIDDPEFEIEPDLSLSNDEIELGIFIIELMLREVNNPIELWYKSHKKYGGKFSLENIDLGQVTQARKTLTYLNQVFKSYKLFKQKQRGGRPLGSYDKEVQKEYRKIADEYKKRWERYPKQRFLDVYRDINASKLHRALKSNRRKKK